MSMLPTRDQWIIIHKLINLGPPQASRDDSYSALQTNIPLSNSLGLSSPAPTICMPGSDLCSFVSDLASGIAQDESNIKSLLQAFDLRTGSPPKLTKSIRGGAKAGLYTSLTGDTLGGANSMGVFGIPPTKKRPEHHFLSTPIRLKEFPRLSPDTLRYLLRSPPPWLPESDPSYESNTSAKLSPAPTGQSRNVKDNGISGYPFYPLTPPSTVVVPPSKIFPTFDSENPFNLAAENTEPHLSPMCGSFSTNSAYHAGTSSARYALQIPEPQGPGAKDAGTGFIAGYPGSLVSPRVLRKFRSVINELQGVDDPPHDGREINTIPFPNIALTETLPLETRSESPPPSPPFNYVQDLTSETVSLDAEFSALLLHRALHEEAKAEELKALAARLETLAQQRRVLIKCMEQRG
ncbi:hypothetical protein BD779DRAFT_1489992 [Infundibulicybe gibba]|nr:hypothetical protein BD779DRAFT_1489992 [Infundibulicybe gibba]